MAIGIRTFFAGLKKNSAIGETICKKKTEHELCFSSDVICTSQTALPSPGKGATPQSFELLKIGFFKFPPLRAKKPFKLAPPISTEIPLPKNKILLESNTVHAFQREICRKDSFKFLLKTLMREKFTNKGEILPCKSVKPCKNQKKLTGSLR